MKEYKSLPIEIKEIMEALQKDNMIANDHNKDLYKVNEVVLLSNGYIGALLEDYALYCINKVYIGKDGLPRISQMSVGPTISSKLDLINDKFVWGKENSYNKILAKWHSDGTIIFYAPKDVIEEALYYREKEWNELLARTKEEVLKEVE